MAYNCFYNPNKNNIENHLHIISRSLDTHSTKYKNTALPGDFNACVYDEAYRLFANLIHLRLSLNSPHALKIPRVLAALI